MRVEDEVAIGEDDRNLEARILVCDPNQREQLLPSVALLPEYFRKEIDSRFKVASDRSSNLLHAVFGYGGFDPIKIEIVTDLKQIIETLKASPLSYSLVAYTLDALRLEGSGGTIGSVHAIDPFMPQMALGEPLEYLADTIVETTRTAEKEGKKLARSRPAEKFPIREYVCKQVQKVLAKYSLDDALAGRCARAGLHYFISSERELHDATFAKIFRQPSVLANLIVVKIGGSAYDYDRQNRGSTNLRTVCQALSKIHQDRPESLRVRQKTQVNRILVTTGAGQFGDILKDSYAKYGDDPSFAWDHPKRISEALELNLKILKQLFDRDHPEKHGRAKYVPGDAFYYVSKDSSSRRILLLGTAPHWIVIRDKIPLQDSDTHTIALAEFYGAERVVLIKRTDRIYDFDPYRGFVFNPNNNKCADLESWKEVQAHNNSYGVVEVDDLLEGRISREGTNYYTGVADGTAGHLMEDSALRYFRDKCKKVKEIVVVHIAPEEMYVQEGTSNRYRHVIDQDHVIQLPEGGWKAYLEHTIKEAFKGNVYSKIVR